MYLLCVCGMYVVCFELSFVRVFGVSFLCCVYLLRVCLCGLCVYCVM